MLNSYETHMLAKLTLSERMEGQRLSRTIRAESAKKVLQQQLQRSVERVIKESGSVQSVLDILNQVANESNLRKRSHVGNHSCS